MTELLMVGGAVVVAVLGAALGYRLEVRRRKRAQAIQRRETTAIAALREGEQVKIRGVAAAREPLLTSPVSGQNCLGYQIIIEDVTAQPGLPLTPLVRREAWSSFLVTDETGTAAVQGPLEILLDPSDSGVNLPAGAYALLREHNVPMTVLLAPRKFRFQETLLKVGDRVAVLGQPSLEIDPAGRGSFREPPQLHVMCGSKKKPVVVVKDDEPLAQRPA